MPFNANDNTNNTNSDINKQNAKDQQQGNQAVTLAGSGGQGNASATGRVANFSSGQQSGQAGSGRFTNLQKYIGANQGSGERMGNKIGENFNTKLNTQSNDINKQNQQISENINAGKSALQEGEGFKSQLSNIGEGLNSFKSMEDRAGFDQANQQAIQFTQAPNFNRFQTIQSGNAIDNDAVNKAQANALQAGTNLNQFTQDQFNKINNEQGRYDLLKNTFGNKKNYSSGNARFDQLFLQNSPNAVSNLTNQFNQGNNQASQLLGNINTQGTNLNNLLSDEGNLISGINTQAQANQNAFNTKLGSQENIDYINKLRNTKYDQYLNQLKSGNISETVANDLGLSGLNTYTPVGSGQASSMGFTSGPKLNADGTVAATQSFTPRSLGTYNTDLANTASSYLQQGRNAMNMQDIASQGDYDAYKALRSISGQDTGKLAGASTLDKAVQANRNSQGQTLAQKIAESDAAFRNQYAGKTGQALSLATESGDQGFFGNGSGKSGLGSVGQTVNPISFGDLSSLVNGNDYINSTRAAMRNRDGSGAAGYAQASMEDFLLNPNNIIAGADKVFDNGGDTNSNNAAYANAINAARNNLSSYMNNIVNQTGVKNQAQLVADDKNSELGKIMEKSKRFGGLV